MSNLIAPIDMILHCPKCGMQHIDEADADNEQTVQPLGVERWTNPPHRSHLCEACGNIWRPADVPTNGVLAIKTKGKADSPFVPFKLAARVPRGEVIAYPLDDDAPLVAGQLDDFMYHGFGSTEDNANIKAAFMSIGLPEKMANDIMARIVKKSEDAA